MIYILLILIGSFLVVFNRENTSEVKEEKQSFYNTMQNKKEKFTDYDLELIAIRKDMAESILDLQQEIQELRECLDNKDVYEDSSSTDIKIIAEKDDIKENYIEEDIITEINFNNSTLKSSTGKVENIKSMIEQGKNDEEICNSLNIGKGEVLLTRELFKS